jgi:hypothetical protein
VEEVVADALPQLQHAQLFPPNDPLLCLLSRSVLPALLPTLLQLPSNLVNKVKVQDCLDRWLQPQRKSCLFSLDAASAIQHKLQIIEFNDSGVAVGSSIGHAIGGMFGGGSSQPTEQQQSDTSITSPEGQYASTSGGYGTQSCDADAKNFTKCMDDYQGNMQVCSWYLEQLVRD